MLCNIVPIKEGRKRCGTGLWNITKEIVVAPQAPLNMDHEEAKMVKIDY